MKEYPQAKNMGMNITPDIWNDSNVNGLQKMQLALIKTLTHNGKTDMEYMTIRQSEIMSTHEKDVIYNMNELHRKGFIEIYEDVISKTGYKIKYKYKMTAAERVQDASKGTNNLF